MYFMYNKLKFLHRKTQSVFFFKFLMIRLLSRHHPAASPPRPSLFVRQPDKEGRTGRGWRKLSCRIFFNMASLRLPLHQTPPTTSDTHVTYRGDCPDIYRLGSTDTGTGVASRKGKAIDGNVDKWSDGNDQRCNIP